MTRRITACLTFALLLATLNGCRLALSVVEGGSIESASGVYTCLEGKNCIIEISDTDFTETFTAVADDGWVFTNWLAGQNMLCGGSTDPECPIDLTGLAGDENAEAVIASDALFYLSPVFIEKGGAQ